MSGSRFSEEISDEVTSAQQRKEELDALAPKLDDFVLSEESRRTEQWVQETMGGRAPSPPEVVLWPSSNKPRNPENQACSRHPEKMVVVLARTPNSCCER